MLEAERQAKAALNKVEKYAVLATIDKRELAFPLLNIKSPIQETMNIVEKELSIPIPAIIGQKAWREERTANINATITSLVNAINEARDKQNEGVRNSVNKTYTYYMQNLNHLINENKSLEVEDKALKAENASVKERISQLDENAVKRVVAERDEVIDHLKGQLLAGMLWDSCNSFPQRMCSIMDKTLRNKGCCLYRIHLSKLPCICRPHVLQCQYIRLAWRLK